MADFLPSPQKVAILDRVRNPRGGNIIAKAGAGTGKTTMIVDAVPIMSQGGSKSIFLGAYNSKMGKELKERTAGTRNLRAGTMHSAGFNALNFAFRGVIKGDPNPNKVKNIVESMIIEATPDNKALLELIAPAVVDTVSMAKQRGIGALPEFPDEVWVWEDMIDHFDLLENLPEEAEAWPNLTGHVIKYAAKALKLSNDNLRTIDFDDMVYLPLQRKLRMLGNDWVVLDEAQDTNPTRRALAAKMLKPGGRFMAVGDDHQAIFGFTGADNDALAQVRDQFDCAELPLSVTYRCPKAVVQLAHEFVPVHVLQAAPEAPQGEVLEIEYKDILDHIQLGDAILCRYNKYLVNLCFKLIRNGVPAKIEGRQIGQGLVLLTQKWKTKSLETLASKLMRYMEREVKKAEDAGKEIRAEQIADKVETVLVLIERAQEQGITTPAGLADMIMSLFDDRVVDNQRMVTLCSVHRSKGLEWPRVFILGLYELMGRVCRQQHQTDQEINLQYVGVTRSKNTLISVIGVKEEKKQHSFDTAYGGM